MSTNAEVALILPAVNEASRLNGDPFKNCLDSLREFFGRELSGHFLGLVVDDGSTDDTAKIAMDHGWDVISHDRNMGKGAAIRTGVREVIARQFGDYRRLSIAFTDADGQYSPQTVNRLIARTQEEADIAVAQRRPEGPRLTGWRDLAHLACIALLKLTVPTGVSDPQAGAMAFKGPAIDIWSTESVLDGYAATTEVLHIAEMRQLKVVEELATIKSVGGSHVKLVDGASFAIDAWRIRRRNYLATS